MTKLNIIEVGVILTFDAVVNDYGTQEALSIDLLASDDGMETINDML